MTNYTDELVNEYTTGQPHWSDLYELRFNKVPQSILDYAADKAAEYNENGFGYKDKDYNNLYKSIQIDANANSDEATYLDLILNSSDFINEVNNLIIEASDKGEIFIPDNQQTAPLIKGLYKFNDYHGLKDHDLPTKIKREQGKTYIDLLHVGYDLTAAWGIEIKTDIANNTPQGAHKCDILLLHILGTATTAVYLPTVARADRNDSTYLWIGNVDNYGNWQNIKIDKDGNITKW